MLSVVVCLVATHGTPASVPPPVPSGMELLYSDRVPFGPSGEPIVAMGLMSGQDRISVRASAPLVVEFWHEGLLRQATVQPGKVLQVEVQRARPAARQHFVMLDSVPWDDAAALRQAMAVWEGRGFANLETLEEGTILGIGGRVLDNRELRLILPTSTAARAERLATEVYEDFGIHAIASSRLLVLPWGWLRVKTDDAPLGLATSFVRLRTQRGEPIELLGVEHGAGYAWHGRQDRTYSGEIYVAVDPEGRLAAVNVLGAEKILEGVVPSELFPSAPSEALRAQAVAARNHLLSKLGKRHHADPFHLCSEQHCQVYAGTTRHDPRTTAAVRATTGLALFLGTDLVDSVYSSTCGGHTESNEAVWGNTPNRALRGRPDFDLESHPELAPFAGNLSDKTMASWVRLQPKSFCAQATLMRREKFRWSRTFKAAELNARLQRAYPRLGALRSVEVEERGPGGRVVSLRLKGERGSATVLRELPIRRLFGNLNSGAFVVAQSRNARGFVTRLTFRGAGWGHGVGMCQLGAIGRAEAGQGFEGILAHYYSGAVPARLYGANDTKTTHSTHSTPPSR